MFSKRARKLDQAQQAWRLYLPLFDAALVSDWAEVSAQFKQTGFSRRDFLAFVTDQDLASALHWMVERDGASAVLPSWLLLHLMGSAAYGVARRKEQSAALEEISRAARLAGLSFLLLKGLHFAERFYGDADARWIRDLDVMVKSADLDRFCIMLRDLGYELQNLEWLPGVVRCRLNHASNWQRDDLALDLHHNFRVRPGYQIDDNMVFDASKEQLVTGVPVAVPADDDCLMLLIISIASDLEQGRFRCKSLVDLWVMLGKCDINYDWEAFLTKRQDEGTRALTVIVLQLLTVALPRSGQFPALIQMIQGHIKPGSEESQANALALFSAAQYSLANRLWFLRHYEGSRLAYLNWWLLGGLFRPGSVLALGRSLSGK